MLHIDSPIWVELVQLKKMSIDVFPALLSTLKRICDVIRSDVINYLNNKNLFNRPKLKNLKSYDFQQQ